MEKAIQNTPNSAGEVEVLGHSYKIQWDILSYLSVRHLIKARKRLTKKVSMACTQ